MQTPHKGDTQCGIAKTAEHKWQTQQFDVDVVGYKEVDGKKVRYAKKSGEEI